MHPYGDGAVPASTARILFTVGSWRNWPKPVAINARI